MAAPEMTAGAEARPTRRQPCGTAAAYERGCRCTPCRRARSVYAKRHRHGIQPSAYTLRIGTIRRIQGLYVLGWTATDVAAAAGITARAVQCLVNSANPSVLATSAEAIRRAARVLGGSRGPSAIARGQARARGYASLWEWDDDQIDDPAATPAAEDPEDDGGVDEVAVLRAIRNVVAGRTVAPVTQDEREAVVRRLASAPYYLTDSRICDGLRIGKATVVKLRGVVPAATLEQQKAAA